MEYPKINSLYKREGCGPYDESKKRYECDLRGTARKSKIIEGEFACPEFESILDWRITEKIDGTNIRIGYDTGCREVVTFGGRTDNAQIPANLYARLTELFPWQNLYRQFHESKSVVLFGEGFGPKIQSGSYYQDFVDFILFDVWVDGWWLLEETVIEVANGLHIKKCSPIYRTSEDDDDIYSQVWNTKQIVEFIKKRPNSYMANEKHEMEGIVARSYPQMLFRNGTPIKFKLKCKDFY